MSAEVPAIATEIFGQRLDLAVGYHDLLAGPGTTRGFLGPREVPRLWERHILNCAVLSEIIDAQTVADVGSGAGLPGIPLAIARPDVTITLIEPLLKRSIFLQEVTDTLGLENVTVLRGRAEEKQIRTTVGEVDVVTSRAVAALDKLVGWSLPLVRPGGEMVALKGSSAADEIQVAAKAIKKAGGVHPEVLQVGQELAEPTTVVRIRKRA
ncbi:MAG: 16S rRNA (guanine(527)-N(7))-methyltransferase RsmG [Corynebacterium sp.]|nr:16S rRNA (guanine(527)-N(7))-methyltransferase RsmG [Corynebacterium sp.]